jgi:formylglycine-generating enzyme required for sulfatase activity
MRFIMAMCALAVAIAAGCLVSLRLVAQERSAGERRVVSGVTLRWCPAGRFRMGTPESEPGHRLDEAQVDVTLTKGFWIGQYEVTQRQWMSVMGPLPRAMEHGAGDEFPVYWVSYTDAETFCERLTEIAWKRGELENRWQFRLPTEAQWEYACRAGLNAPTGFGAQLSRDQANFSGEPYNGGRDGPALKTASKTGAYPPNAWGIYDMHGNEFEWVRDWYHARLPGGVDPDLSGPKGVINRDGSYSRGRRGGAWNDPGPFCRCALRLRFEPERSSDHIGFRVVAVMR